MTYLNEDAFIAESSYHCALSDIIAQDKLRPEHRSVFIRENGEVGIEAYDEAYLEIMLDHEDVDEFDKKAQAILDDLVHVYQEIHDRDLPVLDLSGSYFGVTFYSTLGGNEYFTIERARDAFRLVD